MTQDATKQRTYYKYLDIIRIISCVDILLYHLNILDGGCLAVCAFFVLSGYLSCVTSFNKEKFSILNYYKNRFFKIYIPIVVVTFITVFVISFFNNIVIINLKQEVLSILFAYNNFWQLTANCDYFARHINTPFMHLWYVAILLQYELLFPIIFIWLKKIGDKRNETLSVIIPFVTAIISAILFYKLNVDSNIMVAYYNSFVRSFSWLLGISLGFAHCYNRNSLFRNFNNEKILKVIFYFYVAVLICMFVFVDEKSEMLVLAMFIATILTVTLIDYGVMLKSEENKMLQKFSQLSYEIYLVQYPIIYIHDYAPIFEYANKIPWVKLFSIIVFIITTSLIIQIGLNKRRAYKTLSTLLKVLLIALSAAGFYKFITAKDYTEEMNISKIEMEENKALMEQKQKEFQERVKAQSVESPAQDEPNDFSEKIKQLPITAFGDSVLLGAVNEFYEIFPNIYIDAKISRHPWDIYEPILELLENNNLGNPVVLSLGTNGDCSEKSKDEIMRVLGKRHVFWITNTNDRVVKMNAHLKEFAKKYSNLHIIDWEEVSEGHDEYFGIDGIHLTKTGRKEYAKLVYNSIYNLYVEQLLAESKQKEEKLKVQELQDEILKYISKHKRTPQKIMNKFQDDDCTQDYIKERLDELEQNGFIEINGKGNYVLTETGKSKLKNL